MGFDPRQWRTSPGTRPITANIDALLAENQALRREVTVLRQRLEQLLAQRQEPNPRRATTNAEPRLTPRMVEGWCQAMGHHPAWTSLRLGPPGGLRGLVDELRRHWWNPSLSLEAELDRQVPGLGAELTAALRGPHSRGRWAVRAAFALYGPRAAEWLTEEPLRVVVELAQRVERLERRRETGQQHEQRQERRRGTRTANHSQAQGHSTGGASGSGTPPPAGERAPGPPPDPRHREALRVLGLEPGASHQAIKRAYWRLAKAHHPDLGGDPNAFHRLDAAYQLLKNIQWPA